MSVVIRGGGGAAGTASVDADNNLSVTLPQAEDQAGFALALSEVDSGSVTGSRYAAAPEVSRDFRTRVGVDSVLFDRSGFNYAAQDTGEELVRNATMTFAYTGGVLQTNAGSVTTASTGVSYQSYRSFPLLSATPVYFEFTLALSAAPTTNTTIDIGVGTVAGAHPFAPTDGAYFRLDSSGVWKAVVNYNTTETAPTIGFAHANLTVYRFVITVTDRKIDFWIDDTLYASAARAVTQPSLVMAGSGNFFLRHAIGGTPASAVQQCRLSSWSVHLGDVAATKPWGHQMAGAGRMGYQGLAGGTQGSSANFANSTNPTGAAGSNTSANVTGLGGQGSINASGSAATDFICTSFQVPAGSVTGQTPRNLIITGVMVSAVNIGATVATTPTTLKWSLAFGSTGLGLNTAEAQTTKAPRRIGLGYMSVPVGAVAGAVYTPPFIYFPLSSSPIVVHPGHFIQSVLAVIVGTATASQQIVYTVTFESHYE